MIYNNDLETTVWEGVGMDIPGMQWLCKASISTGKFISYIVASQYANERTITSPICLSQQALSE